MLEGAAVPAQEKLLSLFEPHTQIIPRYKAGKAVEFCRKIQLVETEGGIVTGYQTLPQGGGQDQPYLADRLDGHRRHFGRAPVLLATNRGLSSPGADLSGAMGSIQRTLANDVACRHTLRDLALKAAERRRFSDVGPDALPGFPLPRPMPPSARRSYDCTSACWRDTTPRTPIRVRGPTTCSPASAPMPARPERSRRSRPTPAGRKSPAPPATLHSTIPAWRGVLTSLLRRPEFLYE